MNHIFWGLTKDTPLGTIMAAVCQNGLLAIKISSDEADFRKELEDCYGIVAIRSDDQVMPVMEQIADYLNGRRKSFDVPIHWQSLSQFQQKVLRVVYAIPYGETRSYSQIANHIGKPKAARAVGRANATNPIPLVIPCHRLVGADGSLRGYGAGEGLKTKAWLLELEEGAR